MATGAAESPTCPTQARCRSLTYRFGWDACWFWTETASILATQIPLRKKSKLGSNKTHRRGSSRLCHDSEVSCKGQRCQREWDPEHRLQKHPSLLEDALHHSDGLKVAVIFIVLNCRTIPEKEMVLRDTIGQFAWKNGWTDGWADGEPARCHLGKICRCPQG